MGTQTYVLCAAAASIGFAHTVLGPDHYVPFIVMSKVRSWSAARTAVITFFCGIGHVLSSVLLGFAGIAFGIVLFRLEAMESFRGNIAAWALIIFGLLYFIGGLFKAVKNTPHTHSHIHDLSPGHTHEHTHTRDHTHVHDYGPTKSITPWVLFTIFVFGPCEPLIPLVMYPAAKHDLAEVIYVTVIFGGVTILAMMGIVMISYVGINLLPIGRFERYIHAFAGMIILITGLAVRFAGL